MKKKLRLFVIFLIGTTLDGDLKELQMSSIDWELSLKVKIYGK
ncbi:Uncharacterised protein [Streptococcus pneumoniae]|nr:Uncharacterised protein [Streptococcus pneumoniae]